MRFLKLSLTILYFSTFVLANSANALPLAKSYAMQAKLAQDIIDNENSLKLPHKNMTKKQMVKKANELEAVLISKMIEPMFPEGKNSMLFGGGQGSDIYRHLMIQEYGKILQKDSGLGIAKNIAKELSR